jgi:hypothetical protein
MRRTKLGKKGALLVKQGPRVRLRRPAGAAAPPFVVKGAGRCRRLHAVSNRGGHQPILQPAPESASALAATPITLFSLFSTWRR